METAQGILDLVIKGAMLFAAVLYLERRLTRLEVQVGELVEWKRDLARRS